MKNFWVLVKKFTVLLLSLVLFLTSCSRTPRSTSLDFHFEEVKSFSKAIQDFSNRNFVSKISNILISQTNPNNIYVVLDFGLFSSSDKGKSWVNLKVPVDNSLITNAAIDEKGNLYLSYFDGVWVSYDGGATWKRLLGSQEWGGFYNFVESYGNKIYVGANSKLLVSDNGGLSFYQVKITDMFRTVPEQIEKVRIDKANPNRTFVLDNQNLFLSSDDGKSFELIKVASKNVAYNKVLDFELLKNGVIVVVAESSNTQFNSNFDLLISKDNGKTWNLMQRHVPFSKLVDDPNYNEKLYAFGSGLFALFDYGLSYQYLGVATPTAIAFDKDNPMHFYVGTSCGILLETINGSGPLKIIDRDGSPVTSIVVSNGVIYVAKSGIYASLDEGLHWDKLSESGDFLAVGNTSPKQILRGERDGGIFAYDEVSKKWTKLSDEKVYSMVSDNEELCAYVGTEHGIYKYSFGKSTFEHLAFSEPITVVAVDNFSPNVVYATLGTFKSGHAIYRSVDGGKTWNFCDENILDIKDKNDLLNLAGLEWPLTVFSDDRNIYVSVYPSFPGQQNTLIGYNRLKGGLFVSNDFGKTWHYVNSILKDKSNPLVYVSSVLKFDHKILIALRDPYRGNCSTLEYSSDLMEWKQIEVLKSSEHITSLYYDKSTGKLYIGTFGGVYAVRVEGDS